MKKLIILLIIVLMITVVVAKEKIKETDKYNAYKIKEKVKGIEKDAIKFEIKENKSMTGVEIVQEFEKIKEKE